MASVFFFKTVKLAPSCTCDSLCSTKIPLTMSVDLLKFVGPQYLSFSDCVVEGSRDFFCLFYHSIEMSQEPV